MKFELSPPLPLVPFVIVTMIVNEKTVTERAKLGEIWLNQLVQSPNFKVDVWFSSPQLLWSGLTKLG